MITIAIANQKGGVGKTTTAVNISACLARDGHRTLLVDLDAQANATQHLGREAPKDERLSSFEMIMSREVKASSLLLPAGPNFALIPGHIALAELDLKLSAALNRETRLRRALEQVDSDFDFCLIDCPPSLGWATVNALVAANRCLITIQTNWWAYDALTRFLMIINEVNEELNPRLDVLGLPTIHRTNVTVNREVLERIQAHFLDAALPAVRQSATLAEAAAASQSIVDYANGSRAHLDYLAVTQEILKRVPRIEAEKEAV